LIPKTDPDNITKLLHNMALPRDPRIFRCPNVIFLTSAQLISIFGASITFTLIVDSNAAPKRFTDQTVRDLLSLSWLSFSAALIMASFGQWVAAVRKEEFLGKKWDLLKRMPKCLEFICRYGIFVIGNLLLAPCFLLAVVALAYSDVAWVAIIFFAITAPVASAAFFVYGTSDAGHAANAGHAEDAGQAADDATC
jgi:hypothetical protein